MRARLRDGIGLGLAALVYVALRALILFTSFDSVALPQYELYPGGTLPLLIGVDGGLPVAQVYDNAAGTFVTGYAAWPLYRLFGPTYLALKLIPFALGLATLVLLWSLLRRAFSLRAANVGALLFALGPTTLVKYSLIATGNHFENLFFTALALACFVRLHALGVSPARLAATGAACGFALFVFLGALTPVALIAATHLGLRGWRATAKDALAAGAGFAAGSAPLVFVNFLTGGRALGFLDAKFNAKGAGFDAARSLARLREFFLEHLPVAGQYEPWLGLSARALNLVFLAAFAGAYVYLLPGALRSGWALVRGAFGAGAARDDASGLERFIVVPLMAYLPLTALAYSLSNLVVAPYAHPLECGGYRYFNPHLMIACVLIAIAAARLLERSVLAGRVLASAALAVGLSNFGIVDASGTHTGLGAYYAGYKVDNIANHLLAPYNHFSQEQMAAAVAAYPRPYRPWIHLGLGRGRAFQQTSYGANWSALDVTALLAPWDEAVRADVARGVGVFLRFKTRQTSALDPVAVGYLERELAAGTPHVADVVEGLATDWETHLARDTARDLGELEQLAAQLSPSLRPHFARGWGAVIGRVIARGIPSDLELVRAALERVPSELRAAFYAGLGTGLVDDPLLRSRRCDLRSLLPASAPFEALERARALHAAALGAGE